MCVPGVQDHQDSKRRLIERFNERGVTVLEFVILLPFFLTVVFMIFQFAMIFVTLEMLDNAVSNAARLMRIGTYTGSSYSSALTTSVCNSLSPAGLKLVNNCSSTIQIYVAVAASGSPAGAGFKTLALPTISTGTMTSTKGTLATKSDVLLVIGYYYPWGISLPYAGKTMLTSAMVFQTESY